jgi:hypothetical protein
MQWCNHGPMGYLEHGWVVGKPPPGVVLSDWDVTESRVRHGLVPLRHAAFVGSVVRRGFFVSIVINVNATSRES